MANIGAEFARRLSALKNLSPPVDVEALARSYADLKYENLPPTFSGVALWLKDSERRPEIIVNKDMIEWRRRFTVAHELGHVIIPWHVGNIVDSDLDEFAAVARTDIEREADAFAAELLCPESFARQILSSAENYAAAHKHIATAAEISGRAAAFRIMELADDCLVVEHRSGYVTWAMKAAGLAASTPSRDSDVSEIKFRSATETSAAAVRSSGYRWWRFPEAIVPQLTGTPWREVFNELLALYPSKDRQRLQRQISGIFGAANGVRVENTGRLLQALLEKFDARPELAQMVEHPRFREFLAARATEIITRKSKT